MAFGYSKEEQAADRLAQAIERAADRLAQAIEHAAEHESNPHHRSLRTEIQTFGAVLARLDGLLADEDDRAAVRQLQQSPSAQTVLVREWLDR